jgi:multidrug efflux pump subunit AcrA (membrane-fusion protein)
VPQRGVSHTPRGEATVMVVGPDDKVSERAVTADRAIDGEWLITAGLAPGDRVVLDGLQKIKPGAQVRTVPAAEQASAERRAETSSTGIAQR